MTQAAENFRTAAEELAAEMEAVMARQLRLLADAERRGLNVGDARDILADTRRHVERAMLGLDSMVREFNSLHATLTDMERRWLE